MKQGRTDRDWAVVAVMSCVAGGIVVWALMSESSRLSATFMKDLPAWVQAIGSIAAICVAVAVPAWQRAQQRNDQNLAAELQARSMALALFDATVAFRDLADFNLRLLASQGAMYDDGYQASLPIPDDLLESKRDLHLMGEPGGRLLRALYYTAKLNALKDHSDILWREEYEGAKEALVIILDETNAALDSMNALLK